MIKRRSVLKLLAANALASPAIMTVARPGFAKEKVTYAYLLDPARVRSFARAERQIAKTDPLDAALGAHRPAQLVGLGTGEPGAVHRQLHQLFLEQRNAHGVLEDVADGRGVHALCAGCQGEAHGKVLRGGCVLSVFMAL